jgi:hypothetical protein
VALSYSLVEEGDGKAGRKREGGGPVLQCEHCGAGPLAFGEGELLSECEERGMVSRSASDGRWRRRCSW